ncbi:MAG: HipA family kinase [Terriglobia bacterium]
MDADEANLSVPRVRAVELVRRMRGGSQPWLVRCEDGESYVVKFQNNPQHIRVLANEMLAGRLARLVGLPAAVAAVVEIPVELVGVRRNQMVDGETPPCAGLHFGSRFPGDPEKTLVLDFLPSRLLRAVRNLQAAFLGGLAFDKWTCNCDGRQVIFYRLDAGGETGGYCAVLIDQGFCFNDGDWSFPDSATRNLYPRRLVYEGVRGLESFEPYLSAIENLSASQLRVCAREIPQEWGGSDAKKIYWLAEELFERRKKVRQSLIDAKNSELKPFPNWR